MPTDKITEYGICSTNGHEDLAGLVNIQIGMGYQPYGFVFTSVQHNTLFFHQVMVKSGTVIKKVTIPKNNI